MAQANMLCSENELNSVSSVGINSAFVFAHLFSPVCVSAEIQKTHTRTNKTRHKHHLSSWKASHREIEKERKGRTETIW